jgi:hypothetical protein
LDHADSAWDPGSFVADGPPEKGTGAEKGRWAIQGETAGMAVARDGMTGRQPAGRGPGWRFPSREGFSIHFMAQRIQTLLIDDLDGGEAAGTVRFGLDGAEYEIDLSAAHNDELRKELQQYLEHARRTGTARSAVRTRRGSAAVDTAKVREWAKEQGIDVKDRGRVPANVVEQYQTAAGA